MKRKLLTTSVLVCSVLLCLAAIADISGRWKGVLKMSDGNEYPLTYIFKANGEKLSGSVVSPQGELPMYDGKITDGTNFTFKVDVNGTPVENTGKYYGDSVVVRAVLGGEKVQSTLKREDK